MHFFGVKTPGTGDFFAPGLLSALGVWVCEVWFAKTRARALLHKVRSFMSARPTQVNAGPPSAAQAASAPVVTSAATAQGPHVSAGSRAASAAQATKGPAAAAAAAVAGTRKRESTDPGVCGACTGGCRGCCTSQEQPPGKTREQTRGRV